MELMACFMSQPDGVPAAAPPPDVQAGAAAAVDAGAWLRPLTSSQSEGFCLQQAPRAAGSAPAGASAEFAWILAAHVSSEGEEAAGEAPCGKPCGKPAAAPRARPAWCSPRTAAGVFSPDYVTATGTADHQ
jgi:hypothetical protein